MYRCIVADDEKSAMEMTAECIKQLSPELEVVGCFKNGAEAINFIQNNNVDLVFTDVRMPKMDGIELAQKIFEASIKTKVIIISGYNEFEFAKKAIEYNVINYLLKPLNMREFSETIKRVVNILDDERDTDEFKLLALTQAREEMFADLIMGVFSDYNEFFERFSSLQFPFSLGNVSTLV